MAPKFARSNNANHCWVDTSSVWEEGSFKMVYLGEYDEGERCGQQCAVKLMKEGDPYLDAVFDDDLAVVAKAHEILNAFNDGGFIDRQIYLNDPEIWTFEGDARDEFAGKKSLVEPLIQNFEKFNSNSGWVAPGEVAWSDVMQALSHFSYHNSGGSFVLCDLQGGAYRDGMVLTDPVVTSRDHRFGPTDLGPDGIATFFAQHRCNAYCEGYWTRPKPKNQRVAIAPVRGTSMMNARGQMMVPTRHSRQPMTRVGEYY